MTNSLVFLTVLLLMSGSVLAYINPYRGNPQLWTDPDCADVAWYFLPCMNFLEGFEPDPAPAYCGQLGKLNTIAGHKDGPQRIYKCVADLVEAVGTIILEPHDEALSSMCRVHRGFPFHSGCPGGS